MIVGAMPIGIIESVGGGEFSPADISGLVVMLDSTARGVTSLQWDDLSGYNNHFTATEASRFPTFTGDPVVAQTINSNRLTGPNLSAMTQGEIFIRLYTLDASQGGPETFGVGGGNSHYTLSGAIYNGFGSSRKSCGGRVIPTQAWHTFNAWSKASDWSLYLNDSLQFHDAANAVNFSTAPLFVGDGSYGHQGYMRMMVLYNRKLDNNERALLRTYFSELSGT